MKSLRNRLWAWILAAALICTLLPTAAFASGPEGIVIQDSAGTVSEANEASQEALKAAAESRHWGVGSQADDPFSEGGFILSPFWVIPEVGYDYLTITMDEPAKANGTNTALYVVAQNTDADGQPVGSAAFFPAETSSGEVTFTIPVASNGTAVALVEVISAWQWSTGEYGSATLTLSDDIIENADQNSRAKYKLTYSMADSGAKFVCSSFSMIGLVQDQPAAQITLYTPDGWNIDTDSMELSENQLFDVVSAKKIQMVPGL